MVPAKHIAAGIAPKLYPAGRERFVPRAVRGKKFIAISIMMKKVMLWRMPGILIK